MTNADYEKILLYGGKPFPKLPKLPTKKKEKKIMQKDKQEYFSLSDETILEFVKIFQRGIIECKDVTKDFRSLELRVDEKTKKLVPIKKA